MFERDLFDPRDWPARWLEPPDTTVLWLDPERGVFCVLDAEDYLWAARWRWRPLESKTPGKFYATRPTRVNGRALTVFLHKEVLLRCKEQPSDKHYIGDHLDGNSLNNRRCNLRWATPSMNGKNKYGIAARQIDLFDYDAAKARGASL